MGREGLTQRGLSVEPPWHLYLTESPEGSRIEGSSRFQADERLSAHGGFHQRRRQAQLWPKSFGRRARCRAVSPWGLGR